MSLAKEIFRAAGKPNGPFSDGINEAAATLPQTGRFQGDQVVMDAVQRMERTPFQELLEILAFARTPFPVSWVEWQQPDGGGRLGYLIWQEPSDLGFKFRQFLCVAGLRSALGSPILCTLGNILVHQNGWSATHPAEAATARDEGTYDVAAGDVLRLLLMMNSPSSVLEVGPAEDTQQADQKRAKQGRPPLPNLRPIRFDVTRFQQLGVVTSAASTQRQVAEHFVRGHFKIRKTGLHWWSPHVRFRQGEELAAAPRDYAVVRSEVEGNDVDDADPPAA